MHIFSFCHDFPIRFVACGQYHHLPKGSPASRILWPAVSNLVELCMNCCNKHDWLRHPLVELCMNCCNEHDWLRHPLVESRHKVLPVYILQGWPDS